MTIKHLVIGGGGPYGLSAFGALKYLHDQSFWDIKNIKTVNMDEILKKYKYNIQLYFKNKEVQKTLNVGDIVIFPETEDFFREILNSNQQEILVSDFWNAPKNQSPYPGLHYEDIAWGNPMYDKID